MKRHDHFIFGYYWVRFLCGLISGVFIGVWFCDGLLRSRSVVGIIASITALICGYIAARWGEPGCRRALDWWRSLQTWWRTL
jgi:fucose permease